MDKINFVIKQRDDGLWTIIEETYNDLGEVEFTSEFHVLADEKETLVPLLEMVLKNLKENKDAE